MDLVTEIKKIPPVTRFLTLSTAGVGMAVILNFTNRWSIPLVKHLVRERFQIWRLYTSFFLGRLQILFIFEVFTIYNISVKIEKQYYSKRSADLAWQTFWACLAMIIATIPLNGTLFFRCLVGCYVYLYSSLAPAEAMYSVMGLISIPVKYYPYTNILIDLLMDHRPPEEASLAVGGTVVGYLWWWLVWGNRLGSQGALAQFSAAPRWLQELFGEEKARPPNAGGAAAGLARGGIHVTAPLETANQSGFHAWPGEGQTVGQR